MGSGMIPGMGPAPPNMSAANMVQNQGPISMPQKMVQNQGPIMSMPQKMVPDQIMVSQAMHGGVMMNSPSVVPNQTVGSSSFPAHMGAAREMQLNPMSRNLLSPDNKKMGKMPASSAGVMPMGMPPPSMSPALVSPPSGGGAPNRTPNQRTPPASSPAPDNRDNITLNTAVAEPGGDTSA